MERTYTNIYENIWVCNDCGAHAEDDVKSVRHYESCESGSSAKWEKFYSEASDEILMYESQRSSEITKNNQN